MAGILALLVVAAVLVPWLEPAGFGVSGAYAQEEAVTGDVGTGFVVPAKPEAGDYPSIAGVNSRIVVWLAAQLHLWFAAFVLAVPIFVFIIEAIGMKTRDERYDRLSFRSLFENSVHARHRINYISIC